MTAKAYFWIGLALAARLSLAAEPATSNAAAAAEAEDGTLTAEQIAELKLQSTDEKTGATYVFTASFTSPEIDEATRKKLQRQKKIPIRIVCELDENRTRMGKQVSKRVDGTAHFYVVDPEGKVVIKKTMSLDKLCPS